MAPLSVAAAIEQLEHPDHDFVTMALKELRERALASPDRVRQSEGPLSSGIIALVSQPSTSDSVLASLAAALRPIAAALSPAACRQLLSFLLDFAVANAHAQMALNTLVSAPAPELIAVLMKLAPTVLALSVANCAQNDQFFNRFLPTMVALSPEAFIAAVSAAKLTAALQALLMAPTETAHTAAVSVITATGKFLDPSAAAIVASATDIIEAANRKFAYSETNLPVLLASTVTSSLSAAVALFTHARGALRGHLLVGAPRFISTCSSLATHLSDAAIAVDLVANLHEDQFAAVVNVLTAACNALGATVLAGNLRDHIPAVPLSKNARGSEVYPPIIGDECPYNPDIISNVSLALSALLQYDPLGSGADGDEFADDFADDDAFTTGGDAFGAGDDEDFGSDDGFSGSAVDLDEEDPSGGGEEDLVPENESFRVRRAAANAIVHVIDAAPVASAPLILAVAARIDSAAEPAPAVREACLSCLSSANALTAVAAMCPASQAEVFHFSLSAVASLPLDTSFETLRVATIQLFSALIGTGSLDAAPVHSLSAAARRLISLICAATAHSHASPPSAVGAVSTLALLIDRAANCSNVQEALCAASDKLVACISTVIASPLCPLVPPVCTLVHPFAANVSPEAGATLFDALLPLAFASRAPPASQAAAVHAAGQLAALLGPGSYLHLVEGFIDHGLLNPLSHCLHAATAVIVSACEADLFATSDTHGPQVVVALLTQLIAVVNAGSGIDALNALSYAANIVPPCAERDAAVTAAFRVALRQPLSPVRIAHALATFAASPAAALADDPQGTLVNTLCSIPFIPPVASGALLHLAAEVRVSHLTAEFDDLFCAAFASASEQGRTLLARCRAAAGIDPCRLADALGASAGPTAVFIARTIGYAVSAGNFGCSSPGPAMDALLAAASNQTHDLSVRTAIAAAVGVAAACPVVRQGVLEMVFDPAYTTAEANPALFATFAAAAAEHSVDTVIDIEAAFAERVVPALLSCAAVVNSLPTDDPVRSVTLSCLGRFLATLLRQASPPVLHFCAKVSSSAAAAPSETFLRLVVATAVARAVSKPGAAIEGSEPWAQTAGVILSRAASDADVKVREAAFRAVGRAPAHPAVALAQTAVHAAAVLELTVSRPELIRTVRIQTAELVTDAGQAARCAAIDVLVHSISAGGSVALAAAAPALLSGLRDAQPDVAAAACSAIVSAVRACPAWIASVVRPVTQAFSAIIKNAFSKQVVCSQTWQPVLAVTLEAIHTVEAALARCQDAEAECDLFAQFIDSQLVAFPELAEKLSRQSSGS
jgi:hypothetical protein